MTEDEKKVLRKLFNQQTFTRKVNTIALLTISTCVRSLAGLGYSYVRQVEVTGHAVIYLIRVMYSKLISTLSPCQ